MPPQPARSIASFFAKSSPPKSPSSPAPAPKTSPIQATKSISSVTTPGDTRAAASSSGTTAPPGSSTKRTGFLSDAARKAIEDGVAAGSSEQPAKKVKLSNGTAAPVADVFLKAAAPAVPALRIAKTATRAELRDALASHPKSATLLQLELDTLGEDWLLALQGELTKAYFLSLKEFVTTEQRTKRVFPPAEDIYSWSRLCALKDIRVVIIGQDPYHDDNQAHGLAFSVRKGMRIPPSLRNIYKQMSDDEPGFKIPKHGDLTEWAKHGVLLLNTSLTVRAHEAASHSNKGWEQFTAAVLRVVTSRLAPLSSSEEKVPGASGVVFMAWGAHAQKMCAGVDKKKHLVLSSAHPSPLAAAKGFFGNGHFKKANEWLEERYGPKGGIDWAALGDQS